MYWPGGVRRVGGVTLICGFRRERGKAGEDMVAVVVGRDERERSKRRNREGLSTVAEPAGGPSRSSGEAPVMGAERRGRLIRGRFGGSTGRWSGGVR
jgi:hypothetical protein